VTIGGPEDTAMTATTTTRPSAGSAYRARTVAPAGSEPVLGARRAPRRARLAVRRVDPWSVFKFALVFAIALLIVWLVALAVLWSVLNVMGVFDSLQNTLGVITESGNGQPSGSLRDVFAFRRILGWGALVGAVNVLLFTALSTLGAFLYNVCAELAGGIEVTLTERD
jgi:hypothetical protein